jgi:hypothetical protein
MAIPNRSRASLNGLGDTTTLSKHTKTRVATWTYKPACEDMLSPIVRGRSSLGTDNALAALRTALTDSVASRPTKTMIVLHATRRRPLEEADAIAH